MNLVFLCVVFSATFVALNAASIPLTDKKANGDKEAKKDLLVNKLRELFKSPLKTENNDDIKRGHEEMKTNTADRTAAALAERLKSQMAKKAERGSLLNKKSMARLLHRDTASKEALHLLNRHMNILRARKRSEIRGKFTNSDAAKNVQNRNHGSVRLSSNQQRTSATGPPYGSGDQPPSCESCYSLFDGYINADNDVYDYCLDKFWDDWLYDYSCEDNLTCEHCYTVLNGDDYGDEWQKCYDNFGDLWTENYYGYFCDSSDSGDHDDGIDHEYNPDCDKPCIDKADEDGFTVCFLSNLLSFEEDRDDPMYDPMNDPMYMLSSEEQNCKLENLLKVFYFRMEKPEYDPYNDPYSDPYMNRK